MNVTLTPTKLGASVFGLSKLERTPGGGARAGKLAKKSSILGRVYYIFRETVSPTEKLFGSAGAKRRLMRIFF